MKNRRTNIVDVDLDSYVLYLHKPTDSLMAIDKSEMERFHKLIAENDGIEKIPNEEEVDGLRLQYNSDKNAYDIQTKTLNNVKINELDYTWVHLPYGR
ncbi:MAG: hypothetical protein KKD74_08215 [Bacteroidetes bacterium]|nr:hypothetical protein [Bacteroidota bacterium]